MSIFDKYEKGSFRGVQFLYSGSDGDLGRRQAVHEYPGRDLPYIEDMGRKMRTYPMQIMTAGNDYMAWRDRLIEALEMPGTGVLVHPTLGRLSVAVLDARGPRESTRDGGTASFSVVFVEAGENSYPADKQDTDAKAKEAANNADSEAQEQLNNDIDIENRPSFLAEDLSAQVSDFASSLRTTIHRIPDLAASSTIMTALTDLSTGASDLIRSPIDLYLSIKSVFDSIVNTSERPLNAFSAPRTFWNYTGTQDSIPNTTANRIVQVSNRDALTYSMRVASTTAAVRAGSAAEYESQNEADTIMNALTEQIDLLSFDAGSGLYESLMDLRAAVVDDLGSRSGLALITNLTLLQDTPALVVAYQLYEDASRDEDIVARNKISHPGFIPGGKDLEVLNA